MATEIEIVGDFTCPICIEPFTPDNPIAPKQCADLHPYCFDCVVGHIRRQRSEFNVVDIRCPADGCDVLLEPSEYGDKLAPEIYILWCDALCKASLTDVVQRYCPRVACSELIVDECGDTNTSSRLSRLWRRKGVVGKIKCPNCKHPFCFKCGKPWHAGFTCTEALEYMQDPNDRAFGVLAEAEQWQRCPGCHSCVERKDGCHTMKCRCGVKFCYTCGATDCECYKRDVEPTVFWVVFGATAALILVGVILHILFRFKVLNF